MPPLTGAKGKRATVAERRLDRRVGGEQEGGVQAEALSPERSQGRLWKGAMWGCQETTPGPRAGRRF